MTMKPEEEIQARGVGSSYESTSSFHQHHRHVVLEETQRNQGRNKNVCAQWQNGLAARYLFHTSRPPKMGAKYIATASANRTSLTSSISTKTTTASARTNQREACGAHGAHELLLVLGDCVWCRRGALRHGARGKMRRHETSRNWVLAVNCYGAAPYQLRKSACFSQH